MSADKILRDDLFIGRNKDQTENILIAARELVIKLGKLQWQDRAICYDEWSKLVDALNHRT